jgi:hypothetical protein
MIRGAGILLAGLLLACPGVATTADAPLAGTWKVVLPLSGGTRPWWLVKFENKDNQWTAAITATGERIPKATLEGLNVTADAVRFTLKIPAEGVFQFEAKVPKDNAVPKVFGTFTKGTNILPAELERTTVTSLDDFELNKETLATKAGGTEVVLAALTLLSQAEKQKAKAEEVRGWADKAVKAAEAYGPKWHRETILNIAEILGDQEGFAPVGLRYAQQAERLLDAKDRPALQKRSLQALATALEKTGKAADAKEVLARILKLDFKIKPEPFAGRKGKSDRAVLVELFTGAQCPPCVAADLAFDALEKTFKPSEVILLQYHLHIPGPDPLTNADSEARAKFYDNIRSTPTIMFSGRAGAREGGGIDDGPEKYEEYLSAIEPLLEEAAKAKLKATATQKGNKITIRAEVTDLTETGNDVRLRLALVEEEVAYTGNNKLASHHHVVRALPGGAEGLPLKDKTSKKEVTVDLEEVRKTLKDYLTKYAEKNKFPGKEPALDLKKLSVVAFVQNDETGEVLQAARVEVK